MVGRQSRSRFRWPRYRFHARFVPFPSLQTQPLRSSWHLCLRWPRSCPGPGGQPRRSGHCVMQRCCSRPIPSSSTTSASPASMLATYRMPSRDSSGLSPGTRATPMLISVSESLWRNWAISAAHRCVQPRSELLPSGPSVSNRRRRTGRVFPQLPTARQRRAGTGRQYRPNVIGMKQPT